MQPRPRLMTERIVSRPFPIGTRAPRVPLDRRARRPPFLLSFLPSYRSPTITRIHIGFIRFPIVANGRE